MKGTSAAERVAADAKGNLVDEYRLMIFPVLLGSGRRLFPETQDKTVLRLADTRTFSSGVVVHTYQS